MFRRLWENNMKVYQLHPWDTLLDSTGHCTIAPSVLRSIESKEEFHVEYGSL